MSTENVEVFNRYYGNGVATQFSIGFPYLKREFVKVYLYKKDTDEEKVLNSDQFSFVNDTTIQYPVLPTDEILKEGDILTIQRETTLGSEFEFDNQRRLFPVEVMNADDLAFQQIQELRREINRSVRVNPTAEETPEELLSTVYGKLDSATAVATDAILAAEQATTAAKDAKDAVVVAQQQITETQAFVEQARADINQTVEESIEYVEQEAVKAATEVVGEVVGQYTNRAETAAASAEADANSASASAASASANAIKAETNADEVAIYNFKNKITNCITEIPQDIKLELNNGTLTLKKGSKVYVPNGASKFDEVVIGSDKIYSASWLVNLKKVMLVFNPTTNKFNGLNQSQFFSGTTQPTVSEQYNVWYDTTNNKVKFTNDTGVTWQDGWTLPICLFSNTNNVITSIDQVFNGFGYIGSTIFALPGVKGLIPNGRNADGSLKNIEMSINNVNLKTPSQSSLENGVVIFNNNGSMEATIWLGNLDGDPQNATQFSRYYNTKTNFVRYLGASGKWINQTNYGSFIDLSISSKIPTSFQPKTTFHAVDYDDFVPVKDAIPTKQDIATAVNYDNITNCITEIPQDIKLELNNGTLTLKAGSKVYVPNGSGKFDEITITADKTMSAAGVAGSKFVFCGTSGSIRAAILTANCYSGSTQPTTGAYQVWYDTTNNVIKRDMDMVGNWVADGTSFPIAIVTSNGSTVASIDQVFNGFGYIGSTVFALPGVKGLIPNGRNADGSLKNIETNLTKVLTRTFASGNSWVGILACGQTWVAIPGSYTYDVDVNYNKDENGVSLGVNFGSATLTKGVITSFSPKLPFHAVDRNDSSWLSGLAMPSGKYIDLTLGASGSEYIAPANGWFYISKKATAANQEFVFENKSSANFTMNQDSVSSGRTIRLTIGVKKGDIIYSYYTLGGSTDYFRFIYAEGEK